MIVENGNLNFFLLIFLKFTTDAKAGIKVPGSDLIIAMNKFVFFLMGTLLFSMAACKKQKKNITGGTGTPLIAKAKTK